MSRLSLLAALAVVLVPVQSSARQAAPPPNRPGLPTVGRMVITNQGRAEAIPVTVHGGTDAIPVAVISAPVANLAPDATLNTRRLRQVWEYRSVAIKTGAEGVFVAILPEKGLGIALKVLDGNSRASEAAIAHLLVRAGVLGVENWRAPYCFAGFFDGLVVEVRRLEAKREAERALKGLRD